VAVDGVDGPDIEGGAEALERLRLRHRELDDHIRRLEDEGGGDLRVMALKREKLRIKDRIIWLSGRLTPDIIA
jgi:hypothetical protein